MTESKIGSPQNGNLITWIADTFRHRGIAGALGYYTGAACEFLRDLSPQRRRSRYGDIDYDFDHGVDTSWATVSLRTRLRELVSGAQYQASEPTLFAEILRAMPAPPDSFTLIDLGSGKGRTLLMASDYPFEQIIGVELLEELHQIARTNIARYHAQRQRCFNLVSVCGDARAFSFPDGPLVVYLFNPFPDYVLKTVLHNLRQAAEAQAHDIYVIYHNLVHEDVFRAQEWLREVHRTYEFAIYRAEIANAEKIGIDKC